MEERFERQLKFLIEVDKMKTVFRRTLLIDKSRRENDAEHSWHFALAAMILYEYADRGKTDICRILKMALVHDLVEIHAGDTFAYDAEGYETKEAREREAADRLFALLPGDQDAELRSLWEEFDEMETPDAVYAAAIDRLQPLINNYMTEGCTWKRENVTSGQVYKRMDAVRLGAPELWPYVESVIRDSVDKGYLRNEI